MSQNMVGVLCLIASVMCCAFSVPPARLAYLQLQDRKRTAVSGHPKAVNIWKLWARFAAMGVCIVVAGLGVYLLVYKPAAPSIVTQSATSPVKPEIAVAPHQSTADQSNPRKFSPPKVESVPSTQPITLPKQSSGVRSPHPNRQNSKRLRMAVWTKLDAGGHS